MTKILQVLAIVQVMVCLSSALTLPDTASNEVNSVNKSEDLARLFLFGGGHSSSSSSSSKSKEFSFSNSSFTFSNISNKGSSSSSSSGGDYWRLDEDPTMVRKEVDQAVDEFQNRKAKKHSGGDSVVPQDAQLDDDTLPMNLLKHTDDSPMNANELHKHAAHKAKKMEKARRKRAAKKHILDADQK